MEKVKIVKKRKIIPHRYYYYVKTANYLPSTRKIVRSIGHAIEWVKKMADQKPDWVKEYQLHKSYWVVRIDSYKLPRFREIFTEQLKPLPVMPPDEKEKGRGILTENQKK